MPSVVIKKIFIFQRRREVTSPSNFFIQDTNTFHCFDVKKSEPKPWAEDLELRGVVSRLPSPMCMHFCPAACPLLYSTGSHAPNYNTWKNCWSLQTCRLWLDTSCIQTHTHTSPYVIMCWKKYNPKYICWLNWTDAITWMTKCKGFIKKKKRLLIDPLLSVFTLWLRSFLCCSQIIW